MVDRDTREWQRAWRDDTAETAVGAAGGALDGARPAVTAPEPVNPAARPPGQPIVETVPLGRPAAPPPAGRPRVETVPLPGLVGPARGGNGAATSNGAAGNGAPATPLPVRSGPSAPERWGDGDVGPGSPRGSVRPPDASGTVEAPPPSRRSRVMVPLVAALAGAAIGTVSTLVLVVDDDVPAVRADVGPEQDPVRAPVVAPADEGGVVVGGTDVRAVAQAVLPSVVKLDVFETAADGTREGLGLGSGVIYRSDGYLLTNNHVIENADEIEVQFSDGTLRTAEVIGTDPLSDLAVLRVDVTGLPAVNLRTSPLEVGESAVAIGSPFGLDASVTAGIVSAIDRELTVPDDEGGQLVIPSVVQTDAAINPGNSGGALVDAEGRLIGINTAILSRSGGSQGIGFAISVAAAEDVAEQLITTGRVSHPFLGIAGTDVQLDVAERYRDEFGIDLEGGAVIGEVVDGTGAANAGIQSGDVLIQLGDRRVTSMTDLIVAVRSYRPGDTVDVVVLREGEELTLRVTLGELDR